MTQKDVAEKMNISDKTISKWERGLGCPDITLLNELSKIYGVNIEKILHGDLEENKLDGGNMKKIKFYVCKNCNNIITSSTDTDVSCCGRKLEPLVAKTINEDHTVNISEIEFDYYITLNHDMKKNHYIIFVAYVTYDKFLLTRLYPEQNPELRIPKMQRGKLYIYCKNDGLFVKDLKL